MYTMIPSMMLEVRVHKLKLKNLKSRRCRDVSVGERVVTKPSRRHPLQKRAMRALLEELSKLYPSNPLTKVNVVEEAVFDDVIVYIFDGKPFLIRLEDKLIPSLVLLLEVGYDWLPQVYIDRGAAKAMVRGADLMIPGIRGLSGDFNVGSIVVIVDEESRAPIAVGEALVDSRSLREVLGRGGRGKAFRNVHHVGDRLWSIINSIR